MGFKGKWTQNKAFSENENGKGTFGYKQEISVKMAIWGNVREKGLAPK